MLIGAAILVVHAGLALGWMALTDEDVEMDEYVTYYEIADFAPLSESGAYTLPEPEPTAAPAPAAPGAGAVSPAAAPAAPAPGGATGR